MEAGYEYVCEMGYLKLFRKRKYPSVSKDWGIRLEAGDLS
jgi:hypothetical protein